MKNRNYSVATVPRGVLTRICKNPETYKPKCHHRRFKCILARNCEGTEQLRKIKKK